MKRTAVFRLREFFFPSGCAGCGEILVNPYDTLYGLCENCIACFEKELSCEKRCEICGKPLITENKVCLLCRKGDEDSPIIGRYNEWLTKTYSLFPYRGKLKTVLRAYKFGNSLGVGNYMAHCLEKTIPNLWPELKNSDISDKSEGSIAWVPVPPKPGKIKKKGWDQIRYLSKVLQEQSDCGIHIPINNCLLRLTSQSQKELNKEQRKANMKGRILCTKTPPGTAIIFDDVITTGATLDACAKALLEGGSKSVYGICLFYD